jgi:hypothetical protein
MCRDMTMHVHTSYCDLTNPYGHAFLNTWLTIPWMIKGEAAPTTREFYLTSQRGFETVAMTAWIMDSYAKRGGKCPMPSEKGRVRQMKFGFR